MEPSQPLVLLMRLPKWLLTYKRISHTLASTPPPHRGSLACPKHFHLRIVSQLICPFAWGRRLDRGLFPPVQIAATSRPPCVLQEAVAQPVLGLRRLLLTGV